METKRLFPAPREAVLMSNVKNNASSQLTRGKLIEAAGRVFARRGLHGATLKEITRLAKANAAAVNYHFSDKEELYYQVLKHAHSRVQMEIGLMDTRGSAPTRLQRFIYTVLRQLLDPSRPSWHTQIFWQELSQPSAALDRMVRTIVSPLALRLRQIVSQILDLPVNHRDVILYSSSVIGQCLFYFYHRPVIDRLYPTVKAMRNPRILTTHITAVSLIALNAHRRKTAQSKRSRAAISKRSRRRINAASPSAFSRKRSQRLRANT
ncbi:MAG: CerR family C-terminal domain-containing protein [Phycisphaeraceae bacterium]|nr:CerR family C-terminal domain-containing protein [Phycisphaeraceae bacterium]